MKLKYNAQMISSVFLLCGLFFLSFGVVHAIEYGGLGGKPAHPRAENPRTDSIFLHTLAPGATQEEGVLVVNNSPDRKIVQIFAADSTPSTGGAFACKQFAEDKTDVGSWITVTKSEITLEPGTSEIVPFTITVPLYASVGEHNGCILMQEKKEKVLGQTGALLSIRTGLRVAITVPGTIVRKLEIVGFTTSPSKLGSLLHPLVKNTGNVSVDADVRVLTRYFFGLTILKSGGQYPILRDQVSEWNFELPRPFWGGLLRSDFTVEYDQNPEAGVGVKSGKPLTLLKGPTVWFFSFPTPIAFSIEITVLLAVVSGVFLFQRARKQRKWIEENWVEYEVKPGEDINSISALYNVSWKLLANSNALKAPYELKPGVKIKVPPQL